MTRNLVTCAAVATAASLALAACGEPETVTAGPADPQKEALAKATPKQLPPSIQNSRTYRCADNSLVYVDFYNDNTAQLRTSQTGDSTVLTAAGGNPPYTAEGHSVSANSENVRITAPGKNNLSCHT